jgi:RimJ/RimL family protein N-acetyltransferase
MRALGDWPPAPVLETERLSLEPLRVEHAEEMAQVLGDERLHVFIGGAPRTLEELRARYRDQVTTWSVSGSDRWLNWIVRVRDSGKAAGGMQATLRDEGGEVVAELAWVIGMAHQGRGYAREAAAAMIAWLRDERADRFIADIDPPHEASQRVATSLGLTRSGEPGEEGSERWIG